MATIDELRAAVRDAEEALAAAELEADAEREAWRVQVGALCDRLFASVGGDVDVAAVRATLDDTATLLDGMQQRG